MQELTHSQYIDQNLAIIQNQNKLNPNDMEFFALQCKRTGLDPITRQIYAIPQGGKLTIMASIDGLRLIAERSGAYEGQTSPQWCGTDGKWLDVWLDKAPPAAARVGVYKKNFREATYGVAIFNEYCGRDRNGGLTFMWNKMPALMISKVAESLALRKAFPNEMSGIYSSEEMEQASNTESKDVTPEKTFVERTTKRSEIDFKTLVIKAGKDAGKKFTDLPKEYHEKKIADLEQWLKDGKPLKAETREHLELAKMYVAIAEPTALFDQSEPMPD